MSSLCSLEAGGLYMLGVQVSRVSSRLLRPWSGGPALPNPAQGVLAAMPSPAPRPPPRPRLSSSPQHGCTWASRGSSRPRARCCVQRCLPWWGRLQRRQLRCMRGPRPAAAARPWVRAATSGAMATGGPLGLVLALAGAGPAAGRVAVALAARQGGPGRAAVAGRAAAALSGSSCEVCTCGAARDWRLHS